MLPSQFLLLLQEKLSQTIEKLQASSHNTGKEGMLTQLSPMDQDQAVQKVFGPHRKGRLRLQGVGARHAYTASSAGSASRASTLSQEELQALQRRVTSLEGFLREIVSFIPDVLRKNYQQELNKATFGEGMPIESRVGALESMYSYLINQYHTNQYPQETREGIMQTFQRHMVTLFHKFCSSESI